MTRIQRALRGGIFFAFLIVNPAYFTGCSADDGYQYDEDDMLALLDDINETGTFDASPYIIELNLEQGAGEEQALRANEPSLIENAHACGNRTFVKSAEACMSTTTMPLVGHVLIVSSDAEADDTVIFEGEVTGQMLVTGKTVRSSELSLSFDSGFISLYPGDEEGTFEAFVNLFEEED